MATERTLTEPYWARQSWESEKAHAAFKLYQMQFPGRRSTQAVSAELYPNRRGIARSVRDWCHLDRWVDRVKAWDDAYDAARLGRALETGEQCGEQWVQEIEAQRKAELADARRMRTAAGLILDTYEPMLRNEATKAQAQASTGELPTKITYTATGQAILPIPKDVVTELEKAGKLYLDSSKQARLAIGMPTDTTKQEHSGPGGKPIPIESAVTHDFVGDTDWLIGAAIAFREAGLDTAGGADDGGAAGDGGGDPGDAAG